MRYEKKRESKETPKFLTFIEIGENWEGGNRMEEKEMKTGFVHVKYEML